MATAATALDADELARARRLLDRPARKERVWPVLAAALGLALASLTFATVMITAPPLITEHVAQSAPG